MFSINDVPSKYFNKETKQLINENIHSLKKGHWLNDYIINLYSEMYLNPMLIKNNIDGYIASSYVMAKIFADKRVRDFSRAGSDTYSKYLDYRYLFFPVNIKNQHWVLIIADTKDNLLTYHDSANHGAFDKGKELLVIVEEFLDKIKELKMRLSSGFKSKWVFLTNENFYVDETCKPLQINGDDCGVFLIHFIPSHMTPTVDNKTCNK